MATVTRYHDETKHYYARFARSLGYLDWASQPTPFRSFRGARVVPLYPSPEADRLENPPAPTYDALCRGSVEARPPVDLISIGFFLRYALGLSAWKVFGSSRWSLRVNPSSGNLHPTEAYVVTNSRVCHYAADRHALEERCVFDASLGDLPPVLASGVGFLVALTSIHWREVWKYGERAFRYCQHDVGHAIGALGYSAGLCGWHATVLPNWPHRVVETLTGIDRDEDFAEAEREDAACVLLVTAERCPDAFAVAPEGFIEAVRNGRWCGQASQLSEDHVQWTFIDEIAEETRGDVTDLPAAPLHAEPPPTQFGDRGLDAATLILQRRSAVAFDGVSAIDRRVFLRLVTRLMPDGSVPWDSLRWTPHIHLVLFVHRVTGLEPGLYLLARARSAEALLRRSITREFAWEPVEPEIPFWRLATGDCRALARRVSCDQDIAADGFFSLGMLADFDASLREHGPSFYRRLYWEAGVVGHALYLEAEAAGVRGTGIGCFYDDGVHDALGLQDHALQSLYHFTVGMPVDDPRLTTEPGYAWERVVQPHTSPSIQSAADARRDNW